MCTLFSHIYALPQLLRSCGGDGDAGAAAFQLARVHLGLGYHRDGEERKEMDMSLETQMLETSRVGDVGSLRRESQVFSKCTENFSWRGRWEFLVFCVFCASKTLISNNSTYHQQTKGARLKMQKFQVAYRRIVSFSTSPYKSILKNQQHPLAKINSTG